MIEDSHRRARRSLDAAKKDLAELETINGDSTSDSAPINAVSDCEAKFKQCDQSDPMELTLCAAAQKACSDAETAASNAVVDAKEKQSQQLVSAAPASMATGTIVEENAAEEAVLILETAAPTTTPSDSEATAAPETASPVEPISPPVREEFNKTRLDCFKEWRTCFMASRRARDRTAYHACNTARRVCLRAVALRG
jgi:hypothetical protein